jgi:hypothetical protein
VVEVGTPDLQRLPAGERFYPFEVSEENLGFDEYDVVNQGLVSHHFWPEDGVWRRSAVPFRYVWPAELDLMARLAGMRLRERWKDWDRSPFTSESRKHVSGNEPGSRVLRLVQRAGCIKGAPRIQRRRQRD